MVNSSLTVTPTLIIIAGPTAVGKTSVAIDIANYFNTEIISADSRQFYKNLIIGTAAPTSEQLQKIQHHFIGNLDTEEYFNVSQYEHSVLELLDLLFKKHEVVIMTGGSGLYIKAVYEGIDELPDIDQTLRKQLIDKLNDEGLPALRSMLFNLDPVYAARVDLANPNRIIRALEVTIQSGTPYSSMLNNTKIQRNFRIIKIALDLPRHELHRRISQRVDEMLEKGLLDEAREFYPKRHLNSLNTVGYKELFDYFEGKMALNDAIEKIKTNTRRYARRQITWFKKDSEFIWLPPNAEIVINYLKSIL